MRRPRLFLLIQVILTCLLKHLNAMTSNDETLASQLDDLFSLGGGGGGEKRNMHQLDASSYALKAKLQSMAADLTISDYSMSFSSTAKVKCKYLFIDKAFYTRFNYQQSTTTTSSYLYKLFQIPNNNRVELNSAYISKTYVEDDCFNINKFYLIENILNANTNDTLSSKNIIYGIDISGNNLTDEQFELAFSKNLMLKYHASKIKFLNLSDNNLIKPNGSLLNRFINMEALIIDRNPKLSNLEYLLNGKQINKLKILSLNKCNLNDDFNNQQLSDVSNEKVKLIYLGLNNNRLSSLNKIEPFIIKYFGSIEILDLSFNKISSLDESFSRLIAVVRITKLNFEKNIIDTFNVNDIFTPQILQTIFYNMEISLKYNFIRNTSIYNFKLISSNRTTTHNLNNKLGLRLYGNPLTCDCNSMWLLDQVTILKQIKTLNRLNHHLMPSSSVLTSNGKSNLSARKLKLVEPINQKNTSDSDNKNSIRLIYRERRRKREIEEISTHHNLDNDPNLDIFMQRQKRLKNPQMSKLYDQLDSSLAKIIDWDFISCGFIDVQNLRNDSSSSSVNFNMSEYYEVTNKYSLDEEMRRQNILVDTIKYRDKLIVASVYQDYMCLYEDHCKPNECDCCMFLHCHCRSICPRQCRCYFDAKLQQNIIDCSDLNLIDIPNTPIESATDMRLNANSLKIIKPHTFFGFGQLKYLYLQNNQISYLTSEAFDDLKYTLKLLNLANNQLSYLNGDEFNSLNELNILILNNNPIKDIDNIYFIDFKYLPNLKLIFIAETNLTQTKVDELINYSKSNTNATVKYKLSYNANNNKSKFLAKTTLMTSFTRKSYTLTPTASRTIPTTVTSTLASTTVKDAAVEVDTIKTVVNNNYENFLIDYATKRLDLVDDNTNNKTIYVDDDVYFDDQTTNKDTAIITVSSLGKNETNSVLFFSSDLINLLKWYYFPIVVFFVCLVASIVLVLIVIAIARKFESKSKKLNGRKKVGKNVKSPFCNCCCFKSFGNDSISSSSYFTTPTINTNNTSSSNGNVDDMGDVNAQLAIDDVDDDDEEDDRDTVDLNKRTLLTRLSSLLRFTSKRKPYGCHRSSSFDSYDCYDSASVPVSTSIQNLNLNVFIYYNIADESYVVNYLLPLLKKCLVIIPDTKYIAMPLTSKYVGINEMQTLASSLNPNYSTPNKSKKSSNSLISNILIISDNFYGYKPSQNEHSFMSIKIKNNNIGNLSNSVLSANSTGIGQTKKSNRSNSDNISKHAFKIYINLNKTNKHEHLASNEFNFNEAYLNHTTVKSQSLTHGALRKIYETTTIKNGSSSSSSSGVSSSISSSSSNHHQHHHRNSVLISNDLNSSFGFNDKLQFKLEKHFESICLKSNTFSKTNFSYVDYTKK